MQGDQKYELYGLVDGLSGNYVKRMKQLLS